MIHELASPVGSIALAANTQGALVYLGFRDHEPRRQLLVRIEADEELTDDPGLLLPVRRQLDAYFQGELPAFDLPLAPRGTPFQLRVWEELTHISFGISISYG